MRLRNAVLFLSLLLFSSCTSDDPSTGDGGGGDAPVASSGPVKKLDVLFVIDDTGGPQQQLADALPALLGALSNVPSIHIGVVTTNLGAGSWSLPGCDQSHEGKLATLPRLPECTPPPGGYITLNDGETNVLGSGTIAERAKAAFACVALTGQGEGGCAFRQPLEAAIKALSPGTNGDFRRNDAALAVVILSRADDCSAAKTELYDPTQQEWDSELGPLTSFRCFEFGVTCDINGRDTAGPRKDCEPAENGWLFSIADKYVPHFSGLAPPGHFFALVISGPTTAIALTMPGVLAPACSTTTSTPFQAYPAVRLAAFANAFGARGTFASICDADFGPTLEKFGQAIAAVE